MTTEQKATINDIYNKYLHDKPLVKEWIELYTIMVHLVDDIIDEPPNPEVVLKAFSAARLVFSHPVYIQFKTQLNIVDELVNTTYGDSVEWEKSEEAWKRSHADVLRHSGYNMFFAVIYLTCGRDALREVSKSFREFSHFKHLHDFTGILTNEAA